MQSDAQSQTLSGPLKTNVKRWKQAANFLQSV